MATALYIIAYFAIGTLIGLIISDTTGGFFTDKDSEKYSFIVIMALGWIVYIPYQLIYTAIATIRHNKRRAELRKLYIEEAYDISHKDIYDYKNEKK